MTISWRGGTTADALVRVCKMAGANVVGGGFLIEKLNDAGRAFMSGYQIPLESLAIVEIDGDRVKMVEESRKATDEADEDATREFLEQASGARSGGVAVTVTLLCRHRPVSVPLLCRHRPVSVPSPSRQRAVPRAGGREAAGGRRAGRGGGLERGRARLPWHGCGGPRPRGRERIRGCAAQ